jgi:hypothetical protein
MDFYLRWMKILHWNFIYDFVLNSYRSSLSFIMLDLLLTELCPMMIIVFQTIFHTGSRYSVEIIYMHGFVFDSYRSCLSFNYKFHLLPLFFKLCPLINCFNFPYFFLQYSTEILYMALFWILNYLYRSDLIFVMWSTFDKLQKLDWWYSVDFFICPFPSNLVTDQVWVPLCLTCLWLNYASWWIIYKRVRFSQFVLDSYISRFSFITLNCFQLYYPAGRGLCIACNTLRMLVSI